MFCLASAVSPTHSGDSPIYATHHLASQAYPTNAAQSDLYQMQNNNNNNNNSPPQFYASPAAQPTHQVRIMISLCLCEMNELASNIHIELYYSIYQFMLFQMYHPTSSSSPSSHQLYGNMLGAPPALTNLGYASTWHSSTDYGLFPNSYHYQASEYIPIIGDLR